MNAGAEEINRLESENRQLRERIRGLESEARRSRITLYSIGDGVIATDEAGLIKEMNGIAESLTGWREVDALGQRVDTVFRVMDEFTQRDAENPASRVLRERTAVGTSGDMLLIARSGQLVPVATSAAPIRDAEGRVIGVVLVVRDQSEERRAKAKSREVEERFRLFFDNAPIGKSITGPDGHIIRVNRAFSAMLGYTPDAMQSISFAAITHPDDVAESRECVRALLASECDVWTMEKRYIANDETVVWAHVVTSLQRDVHGTPLYFLTHIIDLSQLKSAEMALRESERRLRCLYDSGLLGVIFWDIDGRVVDANDKFLDMVGYTRRELEDGCIDWSQMTPAEYQYLDLQSLAELKATGVNRAPFDKEYLRKDGTRLPITVAGAMLDEARHHGIAFVLDITERKRAEQRLAEQKTLLQNILASSADAIFSLDREYRYTSFNSRHAATMKALYGAEIELQHSLFEYQRIVEDQVQAKSNIDRCLAGESLTDEGISGADPRERAYFEVHHNPIRDDRDQVVGVAVFARDTTAKRRAEEGLRQLNAELDRRVAERTAQLEEANQELDAFSYSVSHDLRSPLRAIDGFAQILSDEYAPQLDEEGRRICSTIRDSASKMGRLIEGLLTLSRLGRAALHLSQIDMREMATDVLTNLAIAHNERRIDFVVGELAPALADAVLLRQVWVNLISNAIKFTSTRERAEVSVHMSELGGASVYAITDNGIGFDMQYQDKLFGVFQRLHSEREFEGTGVGLALVKRIVLRHGGQVSAIGQPGVGATFAFSLVQPGNRGGT